MQDEFKVYGRAGEPCERCGTPIERIVRRRPRHLVLPALPALAARAGGPPRRLDWTGGRRTYKTEAIVLRSLRFSEADRILHLYTRERGRIGAIAKGIRKTKSRFGARLEPLSHVELMLHEGSGELQTVTGVELIASHHETREDALPARRRPDRRRGDAAPLRRARGERARVHGARALPRPARRGARPATAAPELDPLALSFQLKLLWLSGYLPHVTACVECGAQRRPGRLLGPRRRRRLRAPRRRVVRALARRASPGSSSCSRPRSRTPPPPASATAPAARRSPSSPPRTRSTAASGCARSRHEARARRRLRARRRPGPDRRRRGSPLPLARSPTGPPAATTRPRRS